MDAPPSAPPADGRPKWPAWYGLAAIAAGIAATVVLEVFVIVAFNAAGVRTKAPSVELTVTLLQYACLIVAVLAFAAKVARPEPSHFGFRRTRFWRAVGWSALAIGVTLLASLIYTNGLHVHVKQTTLDQLGAGRSQVVTALVGVLVVAIAPIVEEFVFRGFLYGTLRTRFSFVPAALIAGAVFGAVHAGTGVSAIPPLIVLGFAFCMVYEATGSILPTICLHSLNNMVAFGSDKNGSWAVGAAAAAAVIVATIVTARSLPARVAVAP